MRQIAWLNTTPDKPHGDKSDDPGRPRATTLEEHGIYPELPEVPARYLAEYLFEAGPALPGAHGAEALTSTELINWQAGAGVSLLPWEFKLLRRLSADYVREARAATARGAPAPWRDDTYGVADQLDAGRRLEEAMEREIDL